ncbi:MULTISPECIES: FAD-binding oxidoreductase [Pseudomonadaceae]|jgi:NAD(P)H-flavin reductase|uniref:FAD-binding oxidoreductase n=1 Tax=Pseudomonadaceae TaxID=135621 RepID=UPI001EF04F28|nr:MULTISPECIES: FAD-binding oxidoreductase [Pseudomonadaceae]
MVVAVESPTHDIRRIRIRLAKPFEFSPGQYAMLQFSPEHVRPYSMAGLPDDQEMEFHIRKVPGGRVTEYVFEHVREGTSIGKLFDCPDTKFRVSNSLFPQNPRPPIIKAGHAGRSITGRGVSS